MSLGFADAIFRRERSDNRKCVCGSQASDESDTFRYKRGHDKCQDFVDYLLFSATAGLICTASSEETVSVVVVVVRIMRDVTHK